MKCKTCKYFRELPDLGGGGACDIKLPRWVEYEAYRRQVHWSDKCDLWKEKSDE